MAAISIMGIPIYIPLRILDIFILNMGASEINAASYKTYM